jgi:hypothetical protein
MPNATGIWQNPGIRQGARSIPDVDSHRCGYAKRNRDPARFRVLEKTIEVTT